MTSSGSASIGADGFERELSGPVDEAGRRTLTLVLIGCADRVRTCDLRVMSPADYQLSHRANWCGSSINVPSAVSKRERAGTHTGSLAARCRCVASHIPLDHPRGRAERCDMGTPEGRLEQTEGLEPSHSRWQRDPLPAEVRLQSLRAALRPIPVASRRRIVKELVVDRCRDRCLSSARTTMDRLLAAATP